MIRNYLIIAFRVLSRNKVYTLINIFGLAFGLTSILFIFQFVQFEKSYDDIHGNADNIYRIIMQFKSDNEVQEAPQPIYLSGAAPIFKRECPEVVDYARLYRNKTDRFIISYHPNDASSPLDYLENDIYYADASFMKMFSFPMIIGDRSTMSVPNTVLLSESMTKKLFGTDWHSAKPIGKIISINGKDNFMVQGVFEDIPENSHIKFEALLSLTTLADTVHYDTEWLYRFPTYLQIDGKTDIKNVEEKLMSIQQKHVEHILRKNQKTLQISLQPVRDAHLHSFDFKHDTQIRGSYTVVQFLIITACFILILAWINYINLSTARAVKRAKEVGIRKVIGAKKRQLVWQFLLEAFLINLISIVVALTLYQIGYKYFIQLVQKEIPLESLFTSSYLIIILAMLILGTLFSGGYAAFVLSSYRTVHMMKGKFHSAKGGIFLRKDLIVFQFIVSIGLIIGTYAVYQQLNFMKNYDKGFNISQKLIVRVPIIVGENYLHHYDNFKHSVEQIPGISKMVASHSVPGDSYMKSTGFIQLKNQPDKNMYFNMNYVDEGYIDTYGIQLLHGRQFSKEFTTDKDAVLISESMAMQLGFNPAETALNENIMNWDRELHVIGIFKSINLHSFKVERTGSMFLMGENENSNSQFTYYTLELNDLTQLSNKLDQIKKSYVALFPGNPFDYFFLDEYFNAQYESEEQFGNVFVTASGLSIFIACLGLFGLSSFTIRQRTKEISIRKILGAPIQKILMLICKDYFYLILVAIIISFPLTYMAISNWLEKYSSRISMDWKMFLIPIVLVLLIAFFTVSYQAMKAATTNPAQTLQNE